MPPRRVWDPHPCVLDHVSMKAVFPEETGEENMEGIIGRSTWGREILDNMATHWKMERVPTLRTHLQKR